MNRSHGARNCAFDSACRRRIDSSAAGGQLQDGAPPIARVWCAHQELLDDESLQHAGQRAGMHVQRACKVSEVSRAGNWLHCTNELVCTQINVPPRRIRAVATGGDAPSVVPLE